MRTFIAFLVLAVLLIPASAAARETEPVRPTIILVHGAFADSSSWNGVITELAEHGFDAIAAANPLRGVAQDAAGIAALASSIPGPVVLVGHSYGGPVVTEAANAAHNVKALVYVAGFLPETDESSLSLSAKFPGSTLAGALTAVKLPGGKEDLYIQREKFHAQFAADVSAAQAALMAAAQRPVTSAALSEPSGSASWKRLPSYVIYGSEDRNIPAAAMKFMADRARARKSIMVPGASHAIMVSNPARVAALIAEAASVASVALNK